jgi:hypothetical protein
MDTTYQTQVYVEQGGGRQVVGPTGELRIEGILSAGSAGSKMAGGVTFSAGGRRGQRVRWSPCRCLDPGGDGLTGVQGRASTSGCRTRPPGRG